MCIRDSQCCCGENIEPLCPVHAAKRHLARLEKSFPKASHDWATLPLFPGSNAARLAKDKVVDIIRSVIAMTNTALTRPGPLREHLQRFGQHVM